MFTDDVVVSPGRLTATSICSSIPVATAIAFPYRLSTFHLAAGPTVAQRLRIS